MLKRIATSLCLLTGCVVGGVYSSSHASAEMKQTSQLVISQAKFDFGRVSEGTVVSHEFLLENRGTAPLTIQSVKPACGCTVGTVEPSTIVPGKSGVLTVEFDTEGFTGRKTKSVRIYSNDFSNPMTTVSLTGEIESDVEVTPRSVVFTDVLQGNVSESKEVVISVRSGSEVSLGKVVTYSKHLSVEELPGDGPVSVETGKRLRVSVKESAPFGELRERIVVEVKGAKSKSLNVPVFASVKGPLRLRPTRVSFGIVEGSSPLKRSVKFDVRGKRAVEITDIKTSHPAISVQEKELKKGKAYLLEVYVDPAKLKEELRGQVTVLTSSAQQPKLSFSVFGILPKE